MKYSANRYVEEIQKGKRRFIAKAITLLESTLPQQFERNLANFRKTDAKYRQFYPDWHHPAYLE